MPLEQLVLQEELEAARARIAALDAENAQLRAALEPFAKDALRYDDNDTCDYSYSNLRVDDLRRAARALE